MRMCNLIILPKLHGLGQVEIHMIVLDAADERLGQLALLLGLDYKAHVNLESRGLGSTERSDVLGDAVGGHIHDDLEILRALEVGGRQPVREDHRLGAYALLDHPRALGDTRDEFEPLLAEVVVSVQESLPQSGAFGVHPHTWRGLFLPCKVLYAGHKRGAGNDERDHKQLRHVVAELGLRLVRKALAGLTDVEEIIVVTAAEELKPDQFKYCMKRYTMGSMISALDLELKTRDRLTWRLSHGFDLVLQVALGADFKARPIGLKPHLTKRRILLCACARLLSPRLEHNR